MCRYIAMLGFLLLLSLIMPVSANAQVAVENISSSNQYREIQPQVTANGSTLYFTRGRHPRNQGAANSGDIWLRQLQSDGSWGRALNAGGPINSFAHDELIGISSDGKRLAVLRLGKGNTYIDLLTKGSRSWRITSSRAFFQPDDDFTAAYDFATDRLIYSKRSNGQYDLFSCFAIEGEQWSEETPLNMINSLTENDQAPCLSPDGSVLYFRQNGVWHKASFNQERNSFIGPIALNDFLPSSLQTITMSVNEPTRLLGSMSQSDNSSYLVKMNFPAQARPAPTRLLTGRIALNQQPFNPQNDLGIAIQLDDRHCKIYPDAEGQYAVVVPVDGFEQFAAELPGYFTTVVGTEVEDYNADIATASTSNQSYSDAYYARERSIRELHQKISATSAELEALKNQRQTLRQNIRTAQLKAGQEVLAGYIDPELSKLRSQLATANDNLQIDTIPPAQATQADKPSIRNENNAAALDELEALRSRFRASQEAAMGTGKDYNWKKADPITVRRQAEKEINEQLIPTISREIVEQAYADQQIDSLAMESNIRSGLFTPANKPAVYERKAWENELIENIDPATKSALREKLKAPLQQGIAEDQQIQKSLIDRGAALRRYQDSLNQKLNAQIAEENRLAPTSYNRPQMTAKGATDTPTRPSSGYQPPVSSPEYSSPAPPSPTRFDSPTYSASPTPVSKPDNSTEALALIPFAKGNSIPLNQLRFAPNSAVFKTGTEKELDRLAEKMREHPALKVEIGVHGNALMSYSFARELTQQRADRIMAYLTVELGLPADRIKAVGYGRERPIADGSTLEGRLKNQRVEAFLY